MKGMKSTRREKSRWISTLELEGPRYLFMFHTMIPPLPLFRCSFFFISLTRFPFFFFFSKSDILSPATFIKPVIESMLGQAIPKLMQLYEPFLKPVLSNEVAGELAGKGNEGVKPPIPTFTMVRSTGKGKFFVVVVFGRSFYSRSHNITTTVFLIVFCSLLLILLFSLSLSLSLSLLL